MSLQNHYQYFDDNIRKLDFKLKQESNDLDMQSKNINEMKQFLISIQNNVIA